MGQPWDVRRFALVTALAALLAVAVPGRADAVDIAVTAQVIAGTRTITTATLTPASIVNIVRSTSGTSALAVTVTEVAVTGDADWHVDIKLCGATDAAAIDCGAHPNVLRKATTGETLSGSNVTVTPIAVTPTAIVPLPAAGAPAVTSAFDGGLPGNLAASRTFFATSGQEPGRVYTGTYVSTATLGVTAPADATIGTYSGAVVVTLVE